ncbi:LysR substrate-binding domain-containing protein [Pseudomonas sp. GD03860]|uniref:LysR substrate-binding domain-containing protein n=1 Tax=Pseudomonas TaxID=286 RepID=UPI002364171E|nr:MULTISPECIES: LysR substrate-binding domain-containing protein [Pseudomonas]MDD2058097.1 LysR substrate-binding domain-containing protein [Pseudomonas putida]MDH0640701.1 LysR substrate-binding domain-containing protein [Pseudomonas sp. GD03860]
MFAKLPLTALRTFEAAARLGGFKAAADELAVTPAAVSHQVKQLETHLGQLLFQRSAQRVALTTAGEQLYRQVHHALGELQQAMTDLRPPCDQQQLTLTTTAAFASLWLIPRLGDFHRRHSDIQVKVQTSNAVIDLHRDHSLDLALRAEFNIDPTLYRVPLLSEHFAVYCPPGWQEPPDDQALVLIEAPWVSASGAAIDWTRWCALAGKQAWLQRARFHHYDDEHHALQAAIAGHGPVLASTVLVAQSLRLGLLQPWRDDIRLPAAQYSAVCVPGQERRPAVRVFLAWLREGAGLPTDAHEPL